MSEHRPPLHTRLRLRPGHWVAVDCLAAVLMVPANKVVFLRFPHWLGLAVLLLAALPAALRRFWPRAVLVVVVISSVAATAAVAVGRSSFLPLAAGYVIALVPLRVSRREALWWLVGTLAGLAAGFGVYAGGPGAGGLGDVGRTAAQNGLYIVVAWLAGYAIHQQRSRAAAERQKAEHAVLEQLAQARRISSEERLQIARELHDVVAHTVSLIAVQAGVANYVVKTNPDEAARALASIETTSRGALREMRALLSMLRADGAEDGTVHRVADLIPAPGLADLRALVTRTAETGLLIDLEVRGERPVVSAGLDLAAYRVIQEAITNVVKHAATNRCRVVVSYEQDAVSVAVTDSGTGSASRIPDAGHGLVGMRERVGMYSGEFHAGPLPGHGFQVTARFPLTGAAS